VAFLVTLVFESSAAALNEATTDFPTVLTLNYIKHRRKGAEQAIENNNKNNCEINTLSFAASFGSITVSIQLIFNSLGSQFFGLGLENVFLQDAFALEDVTFGLQVQLVVPKSEHTK
jgi:hypothetical protein